MWERPVGTIPKEFTLGRVAIRRAILASVKEAPCAVHRRPVRGDVLVFIGKPLSLVLRNLAEDGSLRVHAGEQVEVVASRDSLLVVKKDGAFLRIDSRKGWKIVSSTERPMAERLLKDPPFTSSWVNPETGKIQTTHERPFDAESVLLKTLNVSGRAHGFFDRHGLETIGDLRRMAPELQPGRFRNLGQKTIREIQKLVATEPRPAQPKPEKSYRFANLSVSYRAYSFLKCQGLETMDDLRQIASQLHPATFRTLGRKTINELRALISLPG